MELRVRLEHTLPEPLPVSLGIGSELMNVSQGLLLNGSSPLYKARSASCPRASFAASFLLLL